MSVPEFVVPETPVNVPVRRCPVLREKASQRILILRLGAYGDILMGTPLVSALREAYPDAHLTWICERHQADVVSASPHLDELLLWDGRWWKRPLRRGLWPLWLARAMRFARVLREKKYDVFLSFQPEEWPLLTRFSRAPVRIGIFDTFQRFNRSRSTSRRTRLFTHPFTSPDLPAHRTEQYLLALRVLVPSKVGGLGMSSSPSRAMTFGYTEDDARAAEHFLREHAITDAPVVLAPLTTWPTRCWPAERWAQLANELTRQGHPLIFIGTAGDKDALETLAAQIRLAPAVCAGTLTFRQVAALLARAALLVTGDTGPMHAAAAVGCPYVACFGPTSPLWYAPLAGKGATLSRRVPCGPCDRKTCANTGDHYLLCQKLVTVEDVLRAAQSLAPPVLALASGDAERASGAGGASL